MMALATVAPPRIERFKVRNFRALREVEFTNLTPITALLGPNGSGKSTVFDVFAFLADCFEFGLRRAWERRGRARELKSLGADGPVLIELAYREQPRSPLIVYHLEIDEKYGRLSVVREWIRWRRRNRGAPCRFLDYANGEGRVISGEQPDARDDRIEAPLSSQDSLAVNAFGQLAEYPRVVALRNFIMGWHFSNFSLATERGRPVAGPRNRISKTGDNLADVIQFLSEEHSTLLVSIFSRLRELAPEFQKVTTGMMPDDGLPPQFNGATFAKPLMSRFASDGTLKLLSYLILLHDPSPPPFIGIEEPGNSLHPRTLYGLAEEYRQAAGSSQILVTTHSPFLLNALRPSEVRVLWCDASGYTRCCDLDRNDKVKAFIDAGAQLGDLWMEGHFGVGDPLTGGGMPVQIGTGN